MQAFRGLEKRRGSRVIGLIHRQETMNFLGFPLARYIDIEGSEAVLRASQLTGAPRRARTRSHPAPPAVSRSRPRACAAAPPRGRGCLKISDTEAQEQERIDPVVECMEQLQRERAEFLNDKHRIDRERADDLARARDDPVRQLLPAIDDLDRALAHLPPELRGHPWAEGIVLARERFMEALRQLGVERVGIEGERFDPSVHEVSGGRDYGHPSRLLFIR